MCFSPSLTSASDQILDRSHLFYSPWEPYGLAQSGRPQNSTGLHPKLYNTTTGQGAALTTSGPRHRKRQRQEPKLSSLSEEAGWSLTWATQDTQLPSRPCKLANATQHPGGKGHQETWLPSAALEASHHSHEYSASLSIP